MFRFDRLARRCARRCDAAGRVRRRGARAGLSGRSRCASSCRSRPAAASTASRACSATAWASRARPAVRRRQPRRRRRQHRLGPRREVRRRTATRCCSHRRARTRSCPTSIASCRTTRCKDFTPIANLVEGFTFIGAHPSLGVTDIAGLVKLAKEKPGTYRLRDVGRRHLRALRGRAPARSRRAPTSFTSPTRAAVRRSTTCPPGHVPLMIAGELVELAKAGRIRVLATTNERRWPELPDVKTMKEQGFPQFTVHSWIGLVGPAGLAAGHRRAAERRGRQGHERSEGAGAAREARRAHELHDARRASRERIKADRDAYAAIVSGAKLKFE